MRTNEFSQCAECGMLVLPGEYHPYTACVLYRQTRQAEKVQDMLYQVASYGYEAAQKGIDLHTALSNIAAQPAADGDRTAVTLSGLYNCEVCGLEKCLTPGICEDCLKPPTEEEIKSWSRR